MRSARTDSEVIAASLASAEDFGAIFDRHAVAIHAYLARRVGYEEADALVGDVFRVAFERRSSYRLGRPDALPWLYGIAWNLVARERRRSARRFAAFARLGALRAVDGEPVDDIAARLDAVDARSALDAALCSLPERDREAMLLLAWEELSYEEIAVALAIPVGTVRSRLHRARRQLRELLSSSGEEPVTRNCEPQGGAL